MKKVVRVGRFASVIVSDFSCLSLRRHGLWSVLPYDIRETIKQTGAAGLLAGNAGWDGILTGS
jgi:hypothetical protein